MSDWLHDVTINQPQAVRMDIIDDIIDTFGDGVDFLKGEGKTFKQNFNDFMKNLTEYGSKSDFIPASRAIKITGLVVTGLKILKLLIGDDSGGVTEIGSFNLDDFDVFGVQLPASDAFRALFDRARVELSALGFTIIEPTFLADPAV